MRKEKTMTKKQWYLRIGSQANTQMRKQVNDSGATIPKGSEMIVGFDKKLHFEDWTMELQKNMNLMDGVSATGLSDYIYRSLFDIIPMEEMIEEYGLDELEIKEAIDELFVRIGAIAD